MDFVFEIVAYNYGFGWMIQERRVGDTDENVMTIGHGGSINGFNGIFFRTMDDGNFVVLLSNHREMPARNLIYLNPADQIVPTFLAILYNKPYKIPKKSAAYEIARKLMATNDTSVIKAFNDFKNKNFDKFNFSDIDFFNVGNEYQKQSDFTKALIFYELCLKLNPDNKDAFEEITKLKNKKQ